MKRILVILFIFINFKTLSTSEYRDKVFTLSKPDKIILCSHYETLETSVWEFREIKDEILGDFTLVKPLGVIWDKDNKEVKPSSIVGMRTVLDKNYLPEGTRWVQLFFDRSDLSIKSIAHFGFLNADVKKKGFQLVTDVYEFNNSDNIFKKYVSIQIEESISTFPKDVTNADDISARDHLTKILAMTKLSLKKEYEMDRDKSYKTKKKASYACISK
jgi:hypothetical protein